MNAQDKIIFMLAGALIWEGLTLTVSSALRAWRIWRAAPTEEGKP